ncbi:MAG TPA: DUF5071 domain-containing protein [Leptospiraceae bacterium]|nr:DUF5071 domain-containing protein [Leptospirales bacterium]HMU83483.1 DUF5071 domain-containing protein [Leptospiraceae bacterium]HMW59109.1 DUF5071 domain-containing protein [Leptospiraceae bacterium]HMX57486.1 DUF5071 domain-containing protein [Leptospiraceae bacterium]HMY45247.1 DUF5071 domain-containing protein [Leptospiraceae bacterium]
MKRYATSPDAPMTTYILYESKVNCSFTFLPEDQSGPTEPDDVEVWRVEAPSFEIACLKRNEYLGWEPYRPQICSEHDLHALLPRSKHDLDNVQLLMNAGLPEIKPVLPQLFEWIQDINWPVARLLLPFLRSLGSKCREEIQSVLQSDDAMWKYWIITELIAKMDQIEARAFMPDLENLLATATLEDKNNEVEAVAAEVLRALRSGKDSSSIDAAGR